MYSPDKEEEGSRRAKYYGQVLNWIREHIIDRKRNLYTPPKVVRPRPPIGKPDLESKLERPSPKEQRPGLEEQDSPTSMRL